MPSQASNKKNVTSVSGWKGKKTPTSKLELPSGNICKVRRVSIAKLMSADVFPDELSAVIAGTVETKKSGKQSEPEKVSDVKMSDMPKFLDAIDKVAEMVIVEPKVTRPMDEDGNELDDDDRDPNKLYTDDVDLNDKIFVFQFAVGGGTDLDKFRSELSSGLGGVRDVEDVESSTV